MLPARGALQVEAPVGENVFSAFPERGHLQGDHVETKEQILAEVSGPNLLLDGAVRRGDHAHVGLALFRFSERLVGAVVEKAQEPAL